MHRLQPSSQEAARSRLPARGALQRGYVEREACAKGEIEKSPRKPGGPNVLPILHPFVAPNCDGGTWLSRIDSCALTVQAVGKGTA